MNTLIIVNGDDDFLKERVALDEAAMALASSIQHFRLPQEADSYAEFLDVTPLDGAGLAIVIWNASEIPELLADGTTIVVAAKGKVLNNEKAKRTLDAKKPKSYDGGIEYVRWILKEGERLNIDLRRVASALFVNCGTDLRKICSEIGKLRVIVDPGGVADPSVARSVMCFSAKLTPKYVIDAICDGHPAKAIVFYDKLQDGGCETGWIVSYMQRHVIQQLRAELLLLSGLSMEQVAVALGLHLSFFRSAIMSRRGLWSISSLFESFETLCDIEVLHKRGVDVSRWGLESEIIRLSEEAKHNVACRGSR